MTRKILLVVFGGLFFLLPLSKAAAQWMQTGLQTESITSFVVSGSNLFAATGKRLGGNGDGLFVSANEGAMWTASGSGLQYGAFKGNVICLAVSQIGALTTLFAGTDSGVFRSTDSGTSWLAWSTGLPPDCFVTAITALGPYIFAATAGGGTTQEIFRSSDNGINWTSTTTGLVGGSAWALAVEGADIYAGTFAGIFRSSDSGTAWVDANPGLGDSLVFALAVSDPNIQPPFLFAGTLGGGMFRSIDNSGDWSAINTGLPPNSSIDAILMIGSNLFAGRLGGGVYLSTDTGRSWQNVSTGLTDTAVTAFAVLGSYLYAGTGVSGVWRRPLSDFGISSVAQTAPPAPMEIQSYPNPFSQRATISFTSESPGYADVRIVNLLGAEVARLYSGELTAGEHSFSWDANGMAPGMYECVVRMNGVVQQIPMIRMR